MVSAKAYSRVDLDRLYSKLEEELDEDWINRLEPDFGQTDQSHLFVQTNSFNGFLYEDRAVLHILEADNEHPVYDILDEFYDIEDEN